MKAVAYCRYSSELQNEDSIEAQLREISRYAQINKIEVIHNYIDQERSGKNDDRPAFQQMISDAKKGLYDVIIVHKIDRFARNRYDSAIYKAQLKRLGIKILYAAQAIADSPEGRLMEGILESFAEYYSDNLATEVMKGLKTIAIRGEFTGGFPPLGYDVVDKKYAINEYEAVIVRRIFEMYGSGCSYGDIFKEMKSKGYKTKFGADFGKNSLYSILGNKKYIGIMEYNKAIPRIPGKRNGHKQKPQDQIITVKNVIPQIIDMETWNSVQRRKIVNKKTRAQYKAEELYLLTGLVHCTCGGRMLGHKKTNNQRRLYKYYRCTSCGAYRVKDELETLAMDELLNSMLSDESVEAFVEKMNMYLSDKQKRSKTEIDRLKKDFKKIEKEIDNIVAAISRGISSLTLEDRLQTLEQAKKDLSFEVVCLESKRESDRISSDEIKGKLEEYKMNLRDKDLVKCRSFIGKFILSITVHAEHTEFRYSVDTIGADKGT